MNDYVQTAIALLTGSIPAAPVPYYGPGPSALNAKVVELRGRGLSVRPAPGPIPGLWEVSGHPELTTAQLLSL
jgi:hypothetical protein